MINFLAKIFIKDCDNIDDPDVRSKWGLLCTITTIVFNIILFIAKYVTGMLSGSVAIMADSFNNLSDSASSLLLLFGFKFAGMKPTPDRPFGHGRIEYIAGLIVSGMIIIVGYQTLRDAISSIIHPEDQLFSIATVIILLLSIGMKFYMAHFVHQTAEKISSPALEASAQDNKTDTIATALVLVSLLLNHFFGWKLDGYAALIVAALLLKAGIESAWETLKQLLGQKADPELVKQVEDIALSYPEVIGIHDLVIHDYGPGRLFISLHCEVPGNGNIYELHDAMDRCMAELDNKLHCESVIHMDPVNTDDGMTIPMRDTVKKAIAEKLDPSINIHDFRIVPGPTHTNVLFDAMVPFDFKMSDEEVEKEIKKIVADSFESTTYAIVKIDKPYA